MLPRILVTSAAGHTGAVVTRLLRERGFPVRAFVRQADRRARSLARTGAEIVVGDLLDPRDVRRALKGVQRAYLCTPFAPNALHGSLLFAVAAEEANLELVTVLTAWNPHPTHPSIHQREHWLANQAHRWMPNVDVVYVNPGVFAFPYFFGLPVTAHLGQLLLPFGDGLNAPPANEDIGAVVAEILAEPAAHIGRSYRPTGPELLDGDGVAAVLARVLNRPVRYRPISIGMFSKAARAMGLAPFEIAQLRHYAEEVRAGAYAMSAPTDHVQQVCGRPAEPFETTARRYVARPDLVFPGLALGSRLGALGLLVKTILTPAPRLDRWERRQGYPLLADPVLAHESAEWRAAAGRTGIVGIPAPNGPATPSASIAVTPSSAN